ncbi:MAG: class I SAM-dependent methyltransferase [Phycisphaerae bacterium]|nr:class I SAM-dependent methyltransferase [Phycisphaerae bacterium]
MTATSREEQSDRPVPPSTRDEWLTRHRYSGAFERVGYAGLGERYNRALYRLRHAHFIRLLRRLLPTQECNVLDIGCGTGFYIEIYRSLGLRRLSGIDISPEAVRRLRERFPGQVFEAGDISEGLPEMIRAGGPFEVVSAMDVLFHITDDALWRRALRVCGEAVVPGGILIVTDNFPARTLPATASQSFHTLDEHLAELSPIGFRLIQMRPVFFVSNGQVCADGLRGAAMTWAWRHFSSVLAKTIRTLPSVGEAVGAVAGGVLTTFDAILQRQRWVRGFSTKVAVFQRARSASSF